MCLAEQLFSSSLPPRARRFPHSRRRYFVFSVNIEKSRSCAIIRQPFLFAVFAIAEIVLTHTSQEASQKLLTKFHDTFGAHICGALGTAKSLLAERFECVEHTLSSSRPLARRADQNRCDSLSICECANVFLNRSAAGFAAGRIVQFEPAR